MNQFCIPLGMSRSVELIMPNGAKRNEESPSQFLIPPGFIDLFSLTL